MGRKSKQPGEPKKPQKKWTCAEILDVLNYMKETILRGQELNKPSAKIYHERMILQLKLKDVNIGQVTYMVKELKDSYDKAVKWHKSTGSGVETGSVYGHLTHICEHYDLLDEIYGCKRSVNPPYVFESASSISASVEYTSTSTDSSDKIVEIDPNDSNAARIAEDLEEDRLFHGYIARLGSSTDIITTTDSSITTNSTTGTSSNICTTSNATAASVASVSTASSSGSTSDANLEPPADTVTRFKRALSKIPVNKPVKKQRPPSTGAALSCDWQLQRAEAVTEKNKIILERNEREEKWKAEEHKLAKEKFDFEKELRLKELDLKKLEMEKEERLAKMKIEYEYKLRFELGNNGNSH